MNSYYDPSYNNTDFSSTTNVDPAAAAGVFMVVMMFALIVAVVSYVVFAFLLGRIFAKAGVPQWKAWVPIYNNWTLLELGDQHGVWAVLALIPVINIVSAVFMFIAMYHIGLKLGKEGVFILWAIFLPIVWFIWLAVDKSTWKGRVAAAPAAAPTTPPSQPTNTMQ